MNRMFYRLKALSIWVATLCGSSAVAQDMKTLWMEMPDSMVPYLDKDARRNLVDDGNGGATVRNLLGDTTKLDTLTADFMQVKLNQAVTLQLKKLKANDGTDRIAVVRTYAAPEKESTVSMYNSAWEEVEKVVLQPITTSLIQKTDSMQTEFYEELTRQMPFIMPVATLSPSQPTLTVTLSTPLVDREKRKDIRGLIVQKDLKWNGVSFK